MISPVVPVVPVIYRYVANKQPSQRMNSAAVSMLARPHTARAPEDQKRDLLIFLIGGLIFTVCQSGNWNGNLNEFHTRNHHKPPRSVSLVPVVAHIVMQIKNHLCANLFHRNSPVVLLARSWRSCIVSTPICYAARFISLSVEEADDLNAASVAA